MNVRGLRRYVDDLLGGRRPRPFRPDDFEAAQVRTAIDLRAARMGSDAPRQEFLSDLHRRLSAQVEGDKPTVAEASKPAAATRRGVIVGTSAAAVAAVAAVAVDRLVIRAQDHDAVPARGALTPNDGSWQGVAASSDVLADGVMHPFELATITGFVRRVDGRPRGGVRGLHTPGLSALVRQTGRPVALPVSFDVVLTGRAGADASDADSAGTAAAVTGSRGQRCDRGVRSGRAVRAGVKLCLRRASPGEHFRCNRVHYLQLSERDKPVRTRR